MENKDHYMWDGPWLWQCSCNNWFEFMIEKNFWQKDELKLSLKLTDFDFRCFFRCFFRWIWCLNKVKIFVTRSNDNLMPWNADDQNNYQSQLALSKMHSNASKVKWLAHLFFLYTFNSMLKLWWHNHNSSNYWYTKNWNLK